MANSKVAIFVDGKNFYEGLRASGLTNKIDFPALSEFMVRVVRGNILTGLHYYTGIEPVGYQPQQQPSQSSEDNDENSDEKPEQLQEQKRGGLDGFLSFLETQPGCFVYRFPRRIRRVSCGECGHEHAYTEEKAVDTSLVATMIRQAAIDAFDSAVLCSGDADHTPALEALRDLGKPTWVATFGGHGLSRRLRQAAYGHIDLSAAHGKYSEGFDEENEKGDDEYDVVAALEEAEKYFGDERYVGFNMFVKEWRSEYLPKNITRRKQFVQEMIDDGRVEAYEADDGCRAIRTICADS